MKKLFRRSAGLFWEYPLLWAPSAVVEVLSYLLIQMRKGLIPWLAAYSDRSVFSEHPSMIHLSPGVIYVLAILLSVASFLFRLVLYIGAMVWVSVLVENRIKKTDAVPFEVVSSSARGIAALTLRILLLIGLAAVPFWLLITFASDRLLPLLSTGGRLEAAYLAGYVLSLAGVVGIAYFIAPVALKLLRRDAASVLSREQIGQSRRVAAIAVLSSGILSLLTAKMFQPYPDSYVSYVFLTIEALVSMLPYIMLFIALSLLALGEGVGLQRE